MLNYFSILLYLMFFISFYVIFRNEIIWIIILFHFFHKKPWSQNHIMHVFLRGF